MSRTPHPSGLTAKQRADVRSYTNAYRKRGALPPKPCAVCGRENTLAAPNQAHHVDYTQPLRVIWLCHLHHRAVHCGEISCDGLEISGPEYLHGPAAKTPDERLARKLECDRRERRRKAVNEWGDQETRRLIYLIRGGVLDGAEVIQNLSKYIPDYDAVACIVPKADHDAYLASETSKVAA